MKLNNVRIVGTVEVPACNGWKMLCSYNQAKKKLDEEQRKSGGSTWLDLQSEANVPRKVFDQVNALSEHPAFTACFVGYDIPRWDKITHGLHRRKATALIRKMGLEEPSSVQTILLACRTIVTGEVRKISAQNSDRRVMCAVPFNPEEGSFYYFGLGFDSKGDFQKWTYTNSEGGFNFSRSGDRYFWHNPRELQPYCFPLLLGVKPS